MKHTSKFQSGLFLFSLIIIGIFISGKLHAVNYPAPPKPYGATPTKYQMDWQKMEYYMFVHFGPNTFTNVEWGNGKEDPKVFNPTDVDCRQWAATAKAAGMKGIILTAKHHDGFCLWPSKYSTHTVRESSWKEGKGDLLKELSKACREYGLKFGVYLSPWDRNHPAYGTPEYNQIFANTLQEVLGNYGEIFEQWFDGANGDAAHGRKKQVYDWDLFHSVVYRNQPQAIIFSDIGPGCRWMGNERGVAGRTNWSRLNVEGFGPGLKAPASDTLNMGNIYGVAWVPAETDVSIRPGWFYSPSTDGKVKTLDQLLDIYYTSIGRNSNLLLNVPPDRTGHIHREDSIRLMEFRQALDEIFKNNLIEDAKITASTTRGNSPQYAPENILNDNYNSYWTTNDSTTTACIEIDLKKETTFNRLLLQEYIPLGQRIAKFSIEALVNNKWKLLATETTIGYKRILRLPTTSANKIRINIEKSLACPILNHMGLFMAPEKLSKPIINRNREGIVYIECSSSDPTIYYTTDGSEPTSSSTVYKAPFALPLGGTVKAIATISNGTATSKANPMDFDIAPVGWKIISPQIDGIEQIIDGENISFITIQDKKPIIVDLGNTILLKGFSYVPRADEQANNLYRYNLYLSLDNKKWNKVLSNASFQNIKNNPIRQDVLFRTPNKARFIRLEPLETTLNEPGYTITDFGVISR